MCACASSRVYLRKPPVGHIGRIGEVVLLLAKSVAEVQCATDERERVRRELEEKHNQYAHGGRRETWCTGKVAPLSCSSP